MFHDKLFLKIEKDMLKCEIRSHLLFNSVTSCDMVEGKDDCFSFNLLRLSSSSFTQTTANKASF